MSHWLREQLTLSLPLAMRALQAALDAAAQQQVKVSLVIVDASGLPVHSAHMDGAPRPAQAIALRKALTAAGFGMPTGDWGQRLAQCSEAVRTGLPLQPDMALFGGGEPLRHAGQVIGAMGVSGASEAIDTLCAKAAAAQVAALLHEG
ncbi:heme-binding protein [Pseudomonas sp. RP23018S]|uniref:GlcG/HbpS family heme-binding protein n=1 Tax=Pseudomonas sp. RP23018S TaxID=3096037 RepID=UPI002ACAD214|nr:heme-binding protein [Pseudomonas sp. RP23018S]MDZ5602855.1 heme-binding protein [Pseudomonas sp. RP23018S]